MNKLMVPLLVFFAVATAAATPTAAAAAAPLKGAPTTPANTWVNSQTCGWIASVSSYPWTCDKDYACATNQAHVVGCASGTYSPLFSICLDYSAAVVAGSCEVANTNSGCCTHANYPACGTYLWTGEPARSMYRCFPTAAVVTMLDEPPFVLDSRTRTSSSSSVVVVATSTPGSGVDSGNGDSGNGDSGNGDSGNGDSGNGDSGNGDSGSSTSTIVEICLGALFGFFLLLFAVRFVWSFRGRFRRGSSNGDNSGIELEDLPQQQQKQGR